ncbi:hypothetical protein ACFQX4_28075 [Roseomonas sp. GCM10028921]
MTDELPDTIRHYIKTGQAKTMPSRGQAYLGALQARLRDPWLSVAARARLGQVERELQDALRPDDGPLGHFATGPD